MTLDSETVVLFGFKSACVKVGGQSASSSRPRVSLRPKGTIIGPCIDEIRLVPAAIRRLLMFKAYLIKVKHEFILLKCSVRPAPPKGSQASQSDTATSQHVSSRQLPSSDPRPRLLGERSVPSMRLPRKHHHSVNVNVKPVRRVVSQPSPLYCQIALTGPQDAPLRSLLPLVRMLSTGRYARQQSRLLLREMRAAARDGRQQGVTGAV